MSDNASASSGAPRDESTAPAGGGGGAALTGKPSRITGSHLWHIRWVRDLALIGLVVFLVWFGYALRSIFTPVLVGLLLAYFMHPLISWAERKRVPRPASISAVLLALAALIAGIGLWLGPILVSQTLELLGNFADYIEEMANRLQERFGVELGGVTDSLREFAEKYREDPASAMIVAVRTLFAGGEAAGGWIGSTLGTAIYVLVSVVLIPVYFFFFAWHFSPMVHSVEKYIPQSRRDRVFHVLGRMDAAVAGFFRCRLLISLIMAILLWIGWMICGVPYSFALGLFGGALNMIPYAGLIVWPVAIMLQWLQTTGPQGAELGLWAVFIWPSVVYLAVQGLEAWFLTPYIQGKQLEMSAVTVLIVVFIGGAVGGLYGLILCIPVAACIKIGLQEIVIPRLRRWAAAS